MLIFPGGALGGAVCGNGVIEAGEECDDGNNSSGDGCSASCQSEAALSLDIIGSEACYMAGDEICLQLNMDLQPGQTATGFAAFIEYDANLLTLVSATYNNPPNNCTLVNPAQPFPLHIPSMVPIVDSGQIDLNGSSPFPGCALSGGTSTDATLATLCFTVDAGNNGATTNIGFRLVNQIPPYSRVSFQGNPLPTNLYESDSFAIDQQAPTLTCPPNASGPAYQCDADVPAPAMNAAQFTAQGGSAGDDCGPPPSVAWLGDTSNGTCPKTITRTYQATDSAGNTTTCTQTITLQDITPPVVTEVPPTENEQCASSVPPPFASYAQFAAAGGAVNENCDPNSLTLTMTQQLTSGAGCPADPKLIVRFYNICDACNNCDLFKHVIVVIDNTPPTINCPASSNFQCAADVPPAATNLAQFTAQGGSVSDNCGGAVNVVLQSQMSNGGAGCPASPLIITRVYRATDSCGNSSTCTQTLTVVDSTAPVVTPPPNITTNADAGGCTALVSFAGSATDNCDPSPTIVYKIGPTVITSPHVFNQGTTTVTVEATDSCGNTGSASFTVTVNAQNVVSATVVLQGVNAGAGLTRCIHFVAKGGGMCAAPVDVPLTFTGNPATASATVNVPCGAYTSICAKDEQHTQWDTQSLSVMGTVYQANAPLFLKAGDTDNDGDVDINDVTLLIAQFGGPEPAGGCPWNPANRGADFSDNGNVGSEDYSLLSANWLTQSFCLCSQPSSSPPPQPALDEPGADVHTRLPVSALPAEVAVRADLNHDGVIDATDVELFERSRGLPHELSGKLRELEARPTGAHR
jgi:cysteine-rich repeat protein